MLHTGDVINDTYIIKAEPEFGGDGSYKAYSKSAKCYVSVFQLDSRGGAAAQYHRELELLRSVKNEYMPYVYDVFDAPDGSGYAVGELLQGTLLSELGRQGKTFPAKKAAEVGEKLLRVCRYLHSDLSVPVVHGRISPCTVRIDENGRLFLSVIDISGAMKLADVKYGDELHSAYAVDIRDTAKVICFMINGNSEDIPRNIPNPLRRFLERAYEYGFDDADQALFAIRKCIDRKKLIAKRAGLAALAVVTAAVFCCVVAFANIVRKNGQSADMTVISSSERGNRYFITEMIPELGMADIDIPSGNGDFGDPEDEKYITVGKEKYSSTVRYLDLSDKGLTDSDIRDIGGFSRIETLCLDGNEISDLTEIGSLTTLKDLWLDRNNISDLTPLSELKGLERLTLNDNPISDLTPLTELSELDQLCIQATEVRDISPISSLKKLTKLMMNMNDISDLSPLGELSGLEQLYADKCGISDISPLGGCTGLRILYLNSNSISDISPIESCGSLQMLSAHSNMIASGQPIAGLSELCSVDLSENRLTDISFAFGLKKLDSLSVSCNDITDISGIEQLPALEMLYLRNTLVSNADCLVQMKGLKKISIVRCNISDEQVDLLREKMPEVKFTADYY